mmetsp:Transcript_10895/g.44589  ORF Transcript_10895/g.44589 Transcript_10895/m.44589 type:complete len:355 (-) Transcript_10895:1122-2186(-)
MLVEGNMDVCSVHGAGVQEARHSGGNDFAVDERSLGVRDRHDGVRLCSEVGAEYASDVLEREVADSSVEELEHLEQRLANDVTGSEQGVDERSRQNREGVCKGLSSSTVGGVRMAVLKGAVDGRLQGGETELGPGGVGPQVGIVDQQEGVEDASGERLGELVFALVGRLRLRDGGEQESNRARIGFSHVREAVARGNVAFRFRQEHVHKVVEVQCCQNGNGVAHRLTEAQVLPVLLRGRYGPLNPAHDCSDECVADLVGEHVEVLAVGLRQRVVGESKDEHLVCRAVDRHSVDEFPTGTLPSPGRDERQKEENAVSVQREGDRTAEVVLGDVNDAAHRGEHLASGELARVILDT